MCGIVGYTGGHQAASILVAGLRRLEYRGYDSAGVATLDDGKLVIRKRAGRVQGARGAARPRARAGLVRHQPYPLGHARPGNRSQRAPSLGGRGGATAVAVVHNGVIENHSVLRRELESQGFSFVSQTDTEVIAHLIARELERDGDLFQAVQHALPRLAGTYGLAVISPRRPGEIIGARFGSPLVVGLGEGEHLLASDPVAIASHTAQVAFLQDGEVVRSSTAILRSATSSMARLLRASIASTGSPTRSSWAATLIT